MNYSVWLLTVSCLANQSMSVPPGTMMQGMPAGGSYSVPVTNGYSGYNGSSGYVSDSSSQSPGWGQRLSNFFHGRHSGTSSSGQAPMMMPANEAPMNQPMMQPTMMQPRMQPIAQPMQTYPTQTYPVQSYPAQGMPNQSYPVQGQPMPSSGQEPPRLQPIPAGTPTGMVAPTGGSAEAGMIVPTGGSVEAGMVVPASGGAEPGKVEVQRVAIAQDGTWVIGQLVHIHADGGLWQVRYAPIDREDRYGGAVVLTPGPEMSQFREGDIVFVRGKVLNEGRASKYSGSPWYKAESIDLNERPEEPQAVDLGATQVAPASTVLPESVQQGQ